MTRDQIMRDPNLRDFYEERAGILEHDAGLPRTRAESAALIMARRWAASRAHQRDAYRA